MVRKGVSYDVGRVMGGNWRPVFDAKVVRRELEIIRDGLHCNAVRICGLDIRRLTTAAGFALELGLEVWLSPEMWDKSPEKTLGYIAKAAAEAEKLREKWPGRLIFLVGSELTLFMQGIVEGRNITQRMSNPSFWANARAGLHNKPLNAFLARACMTVRQVFHGQVTYASLLGEAVDWSIFDFVGVDHYRSARIKDRYVELLRPSFAHNKPVIITEFGSRTYFGADTSTEGMAGEIVDHRTLFLHRVPILGRFVRARLRGDYVRNEGLQARELTELLGLLDSAGVEGTFIMTFVSPISPYDEEPLYDLDMAGYSLVKTFAGGGHGTAYPDMTWEPKESFRAVAAYYGKAD